MNFVKRGFLSVKAHMGKSLLQIFVFSLICAFVLSGLSIQSAAKRSSDLARQILGGQVTLQANMEKMGQQQKSLEDIPRFQMTPIPVAAAEELLSYSQVKAYNFYSSTKGIAKNFDPIENETTDTEESNDSGSSKSGGVENEIPAGMNEDINIQGVSFTDSVTEFTEGTSKIAKGRHITDDDLNKNVTIVEKTLAEENNLKVGDSITLTSINNEKISVTLEIVGIYETSSTGSAKEKNYSLINPYNKIYVPYSVATTLKGTDFKNTVDSAVYYMKDHENIQDFLDEATAKSSIDFNTFKLDANDKLYQQMIGLIQKVTSFSSNIVYLVTIAGAVIFGLIVMMSIRERKYEMGILLAIGEKRWKLIGQFIVEILLVAVISLGISTATANIVSDQLGEQFLSQEVQQIEEFLTPDSIGGSGISSKAKGQVQLIQTDLMKEQKVDISPKDIGKLTGIGLLIALIATLLPSLTVLRLQPKSILSRQD